MEKENIHLSVENKIREGKGGRYLEKENIFFAEIKKNKKGKKYLEIYFLWRRRKTEKEKEESISRRVIIFLRRRRKIFGDGKYIFCQGKYFVYFEYLS